MAVIAKVSTSTLAMLAAAFVLAGCNRPVSDPKQLEAIRVEALALMKTHPPQSPLDWKEVAEGDWPPAIASLQPKAVTVHKWGVDIATKRYFDGGWGYEVPLRRAGLLMPAKCYSELRQGVFWHGPC